MSDDLFSEGSADEVSHHDYSQTHVPHRLDIIAVKLEHILSSLQHNAELLAGQIFDIDDLFRAVNPASGETAGGLDAMLSDVIVELKRLGRDGV